MGNKECGAKAVGSSEAAPAKSDGGCGVVGNVKNAEVMKGQASSNSLSPVVTK